MLQGSLIANMFLGIIILKKKYSIREYLSIILISVGICISTLASSNDYKKGTKVEETIETAEDLMSFVWWVVGNL